MITRRMVISRFAKTILGLGAAAFLWRSRIIHVATFAAAAALCGQYRGRSDLRPGNRSHEWNATPRPATATAPLDALTMVTYHPEYHVFDPHMAVASLAAIVRLCKTK